MIDIIKTFLTQDGDNLSIALSKIGKNDQEMKEKVGEFLQARYGIDNCDYDFKPKDKLTDIIFNIIQHIKRKSANTEYIHSVDRNYTADKKLNADIMQIDGVQGFCDDYRMISCFADSKNNIQHLGKGNFKNDTTGLYVEEPCVASTSIQNSERNIEILLNMFRAKLIGNFVANKKMGIGVDDVDLDKVICITEGPTDLLDPAYEFQVLGRGGRGNQKGTYFFYRCTDSVGYFEHSDITLLNGEDLRKKFEEARENYIQDEQANIERRTVAIFDKMCDALSHNDICFKYVQATHNGVISVNGAQNWYLQEVKKILIDEFNDLNIQYDFDKSATVEIFIKILQKIIETERNYLDGFQDNYYQKARFRLYNRQQEFTELAILNETEIRTRNCERIKKELGSIDIERINIIDNAIKNLQSTTENPNSYWSRVAHAPIITWEQIVAGDPNSNFPIFMEQKQISQNQDASAHNVGQSVNLPSTDTQQHQDASAHNVDQSVNLPSTDTQQHINSTPAAQDKPTQQTSTKKEVMYGFIMIASPFLAVGIYSAVIYSGLVGTVAFNPDVAIGIFIGVAVAALASFVTVKKVCDKQKDNPDMGTPPTTSGANFNLHKEDITYRI